MTMPRRVAPPPSFVSLLVWREQAAIERIRAERAALQRIVLEARLAELTARQLRLEQEART